MAQFKGKVLVVKNSDDIFGRIYNEEIFYSSTPNACILLEGANIKDLKKILNDKGLKQLERYNLEKLTISI